MRDVWLFFAQLLLTKRLQFCIGSQLVKALSGDGRHLDYPTRCLGFSFGSRCCGTGKHDWTSFCLLGKHLSHWLCDERSWHQNIQSVLADQLQTVLFLSSFFSLFIMVNWASRACFIYSICFTEFIDIISCLICKISLVYINTPHAFCLCSVLWCSLVSWYINYVIIPCYVFRSALKWDLSLNVSLR